VRPDFRVDELASAGHVDRAERRVSFRTVFRFQPNGYPRGW